MRILMPHATHFGCQPQSLRALLSSSESGHVLAMSSLGFQGFRVRIQDLSVAPELVSSSESGHVLAMSSLGFRVQGLRIVSADPSSVGVVERVGP